MTSSPGKLFPAYEHYDKQVFDLMHDLPAHETMAHQMEIDTPKRWLLSTDTTYAHVARLMGMPRVFNVPSITFPQTLREAAVNWDDRSIDILLAVGLSPSDHAAARLKESTTYLGRVYEQLFRSVVEIAVDQLRIDPLLELMRACQESGVPSNFRSADFRMLVTATVDYTKFERRNRLVKRLRHLPLTLISDRDVSDRYKDSQYSFVQSQKFSNLLHTISRSRMVVCPLPHQTGFHERALGAFTAGSAVVAAPNDVLETCFRNGTEMLTYNTLDELAAQLEYGLEHTDEMAAIGCAGRQKALDKFSPKRLVETLISMHSMSCA